MKIMIRTDASIEIGTGHVMRCLTLAKQLQRHGAEVTFICRNLVGNSIAYLKSQNVGVLSLPEMKDSTSDIEWISENWKQDAKDTASLLKQSGCKVDVLVVDHYSLDEKWEREFDQLVSSIFVIDDLANRPHKCNYLLDQNYYHNMQERYIGLVPDECVLLLGPDYVLLRDEFIEAAKRPRIRSGKVENLLIFFGGTDPTGETIKALEAVQESEQQFKNIDVVVGASNPHKEIVEELCKATPNAQYLCQVNNMAELMMKADLAIGAGGSTIWERCILLLPSIILVTAENQKEVTKAVAEQGSIFYLGEFIEVGRKDISDSLKYVNKNTEFFKKSIENCEKLISIRSVTGQPICKRLII
ncbi:UDP-2,4-diacetamido-2,4,6-trideoxy-beta-L-altropyranose hydrolase [Sporosarcina sp. NCCP-2331]|nr:UDP-2,4-diacetamido-2,4,6-trideoxy-beta-L-altropyranose hydrolase [Sporosarcina sp. NCCP-2331]GLB54966.1 UDP-2,4-diacetamido-2,4,6-trideoxy-beta-L-altropyranose hydrolase [Sporosarcina sp. NCCP-2378]